MRGSMAFGELILDRLSWFRNRLVQKLIQLGAFPAVYLDSFAFSVVTFLAHLLSGLKRLSDNKNQMQIP